MTKHTPGHFVWRELMTRDVDRAKGFYGELFGWTTTEHDMGPGGTYTVWNVGSQQVGGAMQMDAGAEFPPMWVSYVSVPDTDRVCEAAKGHGGQVMWGPTTLPGVGRMATLLDASGACLAVMTSEEDEAPVPERAPLWAFCWETLAARDVAAAEAYYAAVLGWKRGEAPSAGMVVLAAPDGRGVCDVELAAPGMPANFTTFVHVDQLATSAQRAEKLGGRVVAPTVTVPKVGRVAIIADPDGATVGLFEPEKS